MNTTTAINEYGYRRFTPEEYDFTVDQGLQAGETFEDVTLHTLTGQQVSLSDYLQDKPLVLETGSMTCPMYAQSVPPMMSLMEKYPQLDHLLMYVREAHPGERQPQHQTREEKVEAAKRTQSRYDDRRPIVVDDVDGAAHRHYGTMPNSIFVIDPDGTILFRSIWNNAEEMDDILGAVADGQPVQSRELKAVPPFSLGAVRTLLMGGIVAVWDFVRGLPRLVGNHKRVGNM
ncbi:deiodinase-like protein [Euzebya tangerina]|uniref:deiodinase-like protein n=1 Tax=Euzebya tangerina TaxID=591198 RepID=UPI000E31AAD4|nr:deiodinase-like protein [Euzebya tangerina]